VQDLPINRSSKKGTFHVEFFGVFPRSPGGRKDVKETGGKRRDFLFKKKKCKKRQRLCKTRKKAKTNSVGGNFDRENQEEKRIVGNFVSTRNSLKDPNFWRYTTTTTTSTSQKSKHAPAIGCPREAPPSTARSPVQWPTEWGFGTWTGLELGSSRLTCCTG